MLKLFKKFTAVDWLLIVLLIGVVIGQVYFDVTLPTYTAEIFDHLKAMSSTRIILQTGGWMILLASGSMLCSVVVGFIAAFLASKFAGRLRRDIFHKVNSFSFNETNKFSTPSLITRSTNDIQQVQMAVTMMLRMAISAPITAVWAIIEIEKTSTELTIATALAVVVLLIVITSVFAVVMPKFKSIQKFTDKLNGVTRENLTGLKVVKAYNADGYQEAKFEKVNKDLSRLYIFTNRVTGVLFPVMMLVMNAISLTIYWLGASLINKGVIDFSIIVAFNMLASQVLIAFMMLSMLFVIVPRAGVSAKRINEVLDTEPGIHDPKESAEFISAGEVEFKNVSFRYPGAEEDVLKNISFKANKGDTVAFIGSTGSGKSTLINLVPRFYDVTEGTVLVNGVDVRDVSQTKLRGRIGYVPQKGVLFSGSVKDNIKYGKENITDDKMKDAAEVASAGFVLDMEEGFDSHIAQGGKNVSGGQKQRLSIARAVAIDPDIYIFDDSFSALDYKTDKEVRANLKKYTKDATSLIVAQRIGTIMDADLIVVLEQGEMAGMGRHKDLLQTCGVYREIALSQLSREELGL